MRQFIVWVAVCVLGAGVACAAPVNFQDGDVWGAANGQSQYTVGDVTVIAHPDCATLSQGNDFGLGVDSILGEDDEIDWLEILEVQFADGACLTGFQLEKLYKNEVFKWDEHGYAKLYFDGGSQQVDFVGTDCDGGLYVDLGSVSVDRIEFYASCPDLFGFAWSDYSVAYLDRCDPPSAVPTPGAVLLGGIGTALVGWLRRRRSL